MPLIKCIKRKYSDCIISNCHEQNCKLGLKGLKQRVILKGEKLCDEKICDCIIFVKNQSIILGLIELKSKTIHMSKLIQKFDNCIIISSDIFKKCCNDQITPKLFPIVLSKRVSASEDKKIKARKIKFNGKYISIIPKRCGTEFSEIIKAFK